MSKSNHHFNALIFINLFLITSFIFSLNISFAFASSSPPPPRFHRRDFLDHFEFYHGGYNLTNNHYWASAVFTGIHGYAVAGVWMICGLLGFGFFMTINKNNVHHANIYSDFSYYLVVFLILFFSLLAIIATGFVITENEKTFKSAKKLKQTILGAGDDARETIHKIIQVLNSIQSLLSPYDESTCFLLDTTSHHLGNESYHINKIVQKNEHSIDQAIRALHITNLVVAVVNLLFLVAGLVIGLLHWHPGFFIIIFLCWIFTMACWFLTGIDFFFHNFAEDTCMALEDFEHNPKNSSLSSLLPCAHAFKSLSFIHIIGQTVHDFITQVNLNMKNIVPKLNGLDETYYDNVLGDKRICDPFAGPPDYEYLDGKCPDHAIPIADLPNILAKFTCDSEITMQSCKDKGKFLPKPTYLMAYAYVQSIQYLISVFPDLESLLHCSFVHNRISEVVLHQCKPFEASTYALWISILCLSMTMVILVLLLVVKAYQDHKRCLSNKLLKIASNEEP